MIINLIDSSIGFGHADKMAEFCKTNRFVFTPPSSALPPYC